MILNANKRSIALNVRTKSGHEILEQLIKTGDVFIENFGPGAIERLGFGYDAVREMNPRMIYAQIKGFGRGSQYEDFLSFDCIGQAVGGAYSINGERDGPPLRVGPTLGDTGTGLHITVGILAALVQRERTGVGQHVEVAMQEAMINYCRVAFAEQLMTGEAAKRHGNMFPMPSAPTGLYPCRGGGPNDYCVLYTSRANNVQWHRLLEAIGRAELQDDPRFATPELRREHVDEVDKVLSEWTITRTKHEVMEHLGSAGVPVGATLDTAELASDPYLHERGMFVTVDHPVAGKFTMPGWPVHMSASRVPITRAPLLGEHTQEILDELGVADVGDALLEVSKAVAW
jgi:formyl-CoA transferase